MRDRPFHTIRVLLAKVLAIPLAIRTGLRIVFCDRRIAKQPTTAPEILRELAKSSDYAVRKSVVSNPNTPPEVLLELGQFFPKLLLKNPMFDLLLLAEPTLFASMPKATLHSIVSLKNIPVGYLEQAATVPHLWTSTVQSIAKHPNASAETLEKLASYSADRTIAQLLIKRYLTQRKSLPELVMEAFVTHGHDLVRLYIAQHYNPPAPILEKLAARGQQTQLFLAQQPLSESVLEVLVNRGSSDVQLYIAQHHSLSVTQLEKLAKRDRAVQEYLAQQPDAPVSVLAILLQSKHGEVQERLMRRTDLISYFEDWAQKGSLSLQRSLAKRISPSDTKVLEGLVIYGHPEVQFGLAKRSDLPNHIIEMLAEHGTKRTQLYLAQQPNQSIEVLQKLVEHGYRSVKIRLTQQHHTPIEILGKLAVDENPVVRRMTAQSSNLPLNLLKQLAQDVDRQVQEIARQRLVKIESKREQL